MIDRIIEFSVRNRLLIVMACGAIAIAGWVAMNRTPIDAIPDVSENQVIVYADWPGRSPQEVEDQITYPLAFGLKGLAGVKSVRAQSMFGFSLVYVIFEDGLDFYFARTRVLEKLPLVTLPEGVKAVLGPDGTGVGQVFWYTVENGWYCPDHPFPARAAAGECPKVAQPLVKAEYDLAELRSRQDWFVRYQLSSVTGVAEVASVGGFVRQYHIDVHPNKLVAHGVTIGTVFEAVMRSNTNVGAAVFEQSGNEYIVRGVGLIRHLADIENIVVAAPNGVPVYVRNVATVQLGPDFRRGALEKDGVEAVGGVVLARQGTKFADVVDGVKAKIAEIGPGLPPGMRIVPFYDRNKLVGRAIDPLRTALVEQLIPIARAHLRFLMHFRSILIVTIPLPLAILTSFLFMGGLDMTANIMSLAGIAIAIGELTDAGIVVTENAFRKIEQDRIDTTDRPRVWQAVLDASKLVGRPIFFSMVIIIVAFLPVFALTGQSAKMFHPLAFTKTFAMIGAAIISVTLVPVLCTLLLRGKMHSEEDNILLRGARAVYLPVLNLALRHKAATVALAVTLLVTSCCLAFGAGTVLLAPLRLPIQIANTATGLEVAPRGHARLLSWTDDLNLLLTPGLGTEYMPPLDEQDLLFMPVTAPTVSLTGAVEIMKHQDSVLRGFPEVEQVVGKDGRAETPTDPAPVSMFETVVNLKPYHEWPARAIRESLVRDAFDRVFHALVSDGTLRPHRHALWKRRSDFYASIAGRELTPALIEQKRVLEQSLRDSYEKELARPFLRKVTLAVDRFTRDKVWGKKDYDEMLAGLRPVFESAAVGAFMELAASPTMDLHRIKTVDEARVKEIVAKAPFRNPVERYTKERLRDDVLDAETRLVGVSNIWTQPIINRVDMLTTGVRTEIGVKIFGTGRDMDKALETMEQLTRRVADVVKAVSGAADVFPEPIKGAQFLEIRIDRERAARYGVSVAEANDVIEAAVGGRTLTTTIEGRERYSVRVRYVRDVRDSVTDIGRVLVHTAEGGTVPLVQIADIRIVAGPAMISSENGRLRAVVFLNVRGRDVIGFVNEARKAVEEHVKTPEGFSIEWDGRFKHTVADNQRFLLVFPLTVAIIVVLLYFVYGSWKEALHVALAVPFALTGGFLSMAFLGYNFSTAVWVGFIALFGTAAETGIVMVIYLEEALESRVKRGVPITTAELHKAVVEGALLRLRPKLMTVGTTLAGLIPIMWATGAGAEVMKPLAAPVIGGMFSSLLHVLVVTPVIFSAIRARQADAVDRTILQGQPLKIPPGAMQ